MYEWQLTPSVTTPVIGDNLPAVHSTREEMIEPVVREALAAAGPHARALDLGCNEGLFCHRLLEWGAASVVGVDTREPNIRRATLVRDHFRDLPRADALHPGRRARSRPRGPGPLRRGAPAQADLSPRTAAVGDPPRAPDDPPAVCDREPADAPGRADRPGRRDPGRLHRKPGELRGVGRGRLRRESALLHERRHEPRSQPRGPGDDARMGRL